MGYKALIESLLYVWGTYSDQKIGPRYGRRYGIMVKYFWTLAFRTKSRAF